MYWDGWFPMLLGWILLCLAMTGLCMLFVACGSGSNSALQRLNERFARGEIGDSEYNAEREVILQL